IAHPSWYAVSLEDALSIDVAHAVEIYNHTAHHHNDKGDSTALIEQLLMQGRKVHILATDDAHFNSRPDFFGGWVMVKSDSLDPDSILTALKAGHYYSSQGPQLVDVTVTDTVVQVKSSPVQSMYLTGPGSLVERLRGERLTSETLPLKRFKDQYCRVTVVDEFGRRAWTNPIWLG
ncbi:MAG: phosphotransferase, partial [Thermomicrobiales bacterium]